MQTAPQKTITRIPTVRPAAAVPVVQRSAVAGPGAFRIQTSMKVSSPSDPAEREAVNTASRVMRMTLPDNAAPRFSSMAGTVHPKVAEEKLEKRPQARFESPYLARFSMPAALSRQQRPEELKIQRKADGPTVVAPDVAGGIQANLAGGSPLPTPVRHFMEPRFRADFANVRVHTGESAGRLNRRLNAQAFTYGNNIFFGKGRFRPESSEGKELIAHELTHTIQQGAVIQRSEEAPVTQQSPPQVQRLGIGDALKHFANEANNIPGFRMFTIILGVNPINMSSVDRSAGNILRALIEFIPGGKFITDALANHGIFDKVSTWAQQQISTLAMTGASIKQAITTFLDSLSWTDIFDLGGVWERAKRIFTEPIDRIISFAKGLITGIIQLIKDAILRPIAKLAEGTAGYDLLKGVLGEDPITGEAVPRNAETLVGPFMRLIGQGDIWDNMKRANAIPRCWAWFQGALGSLISLVSSLPSRFIAAFKSLTLEDIILVPLAFGKLASVFGGFLVDFISWGGRAAWNLLEIIFDVVSPGALGYIKRTGAAIKSIFKNPLPFVGNLVKAAKLGFQNFAGNFLGHLKAGLIDWLTGSLPGIYIPKGFTLQEILKFVLSVLGLSWANIRLKLVKVVGETAVKAMETGFDIVVTLVRDGPAAAWDKIKEHLANLKDMVVEGITSMVVEMVVVKAVPKLIAMFIPGAGFISAIISIYDTVMVFIRKISQIIQVVTGFIDSIVAIASGAIGAAASRVESTLARLLSLAINFLAGFAGLGKVADKVMGVIMKIRAPIDKALDALIGWIVAMAKRLGRFVAQAGVPQDPNERLRLAIRAAIAAARGLSGGFTQALYEPVLGAIKTRYALVDIRPFERSGRWWVRATINPTSEADTEVASTVAGAGDDGSVVITVISTRQPRPSAIPASSVGRLASRETSPAHFELDTTRAIASATGLTPERAGRFQVKEGSNLFERTAPSGFVEGPGGILLPAQPRLFGSLATDPRQRDREEPRTEVRAGDLRKRGMVRNPDGLLVTPEQIEPLEFTLDCSLSLRGQGQTRGATPHKLLQIPGTVENLLRIFPRETPVVYSVFVRGSVPQPRVDELKSALMRLGGNVNVTVRFVRR